MNEVETELLPRVKLIPLKSTWTCPECDRQNTYVEGIVSKPQDVCWHCETKVQIGATRTRTSADIRTQAQRAATEIHRLATRSLSGKVPAVQTMEEIIKSGLRPLQVCLDCGHFKGLREPEGHCVVCGCSCRFAAIIESEFSAPSIPISQPAEKCVKCGHSNLSVDGRCKESVNICSDGYHGTRECGCKCDFSPSPERVEPKN